MAMGTVVKKRGKESTTWWNIWLMAARQCAMSWVRFLNRHRTGTVIIALATLVFFWPVVIRMGSYSPGGDAMFNAWEIARNQHCILRQHCPNYADANIFFPHKDTMLYSESQLSPAIVTLPFHFLTQNPILQYNFLTIVLFFMSGWSMYLLAKYLGRGREVVSVAAGLIFEFAPFKMDSTWWHLQNLSIFCLPLAVLLILKYFENRQRKYLWLLLTALLYVFFASWVQMVFVLIAVTALLVGARLFKFASWRSVLLVASVTLVALLSTAPLALQYLHFSKTNDANFSVLDQELFGSSVADYFIPYSGTAAGKLYHALLPHARVDAYNLDSYSYHGIILYAIGLFVLVTAYRYRQRLKATLDRRNHSLIAILAIIALAGFLISLGPFLKIKGGYTYPGLGDGMPVVIPTPYALVDKLLPQLHFIRAVGRASVLFLFALCCFLAFFPAFLDRYASLKKRRKLIFGGVGLLIFVELMPLQMIPMSRVPQTYNLQIPAVYKYVSAHPAVDNIVILQGNDDYKNADQPIAWTLNVLWAGYHNRNIFNGYSGYIPPSYLLDYIKMINFDPATTPAFMKSLGLKYVIINKALSGPDSHKPYMLSTIRQTFPTVYEDKDYVLFRVQ